MILSEMPWWVSAAAGAASILLAWIISSLVFGGARRRRGDPVAPVSLPGLENVQSLDEASARILDHVATWVKGKSYHAYWLDDKGGAWWLRASLTRPEYPDVAPNYSGLVMDGSRAVPLSLPFDATLTSSRIRGPRDERWLDLPIGKDLLVTVLLGPIGALSVAEIRRLDQSCQTLAPLALTVRRWRSAMEEAQHYRDLLESTRVALDVTLHIDRAVELLLNVGGQAVEALVQVAVVEGPKEPLIISNSSEGKALGRRIAENAEPRLMALPPQPDVVPGSRMPTLGSLYNGCVRVPVMVSGKEPVGCFFYFMKHAPAVNGYQTAVLRALGERASQLVASQRQVQNASAGYADTLGILVNAMDGLSPHSQGHSLRVARLARMIAGQMKLPPDEAQAVAQGAFYHDVGMVAVDPRVVLKPQKLTSGEYQQVKRHAELGGQLVSALPAALPLGEIVAGHHERWDGDGYPRGLRGEEIPLGARIVAAADLFEAKTTGRAYRSPVPFLQAVQDIRAAAGSHLDPQVVGALVAAFAEAARAVSPSLPLAACWEMRCIPAAVCSGCVNRQTGAGRCWEAGSNLCSRHGDRCAECLVYTEATSRLAAGRA